MENRIYVDNFAGPVEASRVQEFADVKPMALRTDRGPGAALVTMATDEAAGAAIKGLNRTSLHGRLIRVEVAAQRCAGSRGVA